MKAYLKRLSDEYLAEFVYGGIDGAVTTFAVVAGSAGAKFPVAIALVLGVANLIADGFSMAVSAYLSARSERELYDRERNKVKGAMKDTAAERSLIQNLYRKRGFRGKLLDDIVSVIHRDRGHFVDVVMAEDKGLLPERKSSAKIGATTFAAFIIVGLVPLLAYIFNFTLDLSGDQLFILSAILTGVAFIIVGLLKSIVTQSSKPRAIAETLLLGAIAAGFAYVLGYLLEKAVT